MDLKVKSSTTLKNGMGAKGSETKAEKESERQSSHAKVRD